MRASPRNDQQTLAMQNRAMREYAARRGWTIALQVREVNSGAARREAREKLLEAARRREIDLVLVAAGPLGPIGNGRHCMTWSISESASSR
jgi:DNA invertase Pin-like site-specific DNA recombinase